MIEGKKPDPMAQPWISWTYSNGRQHWFLCGPSETWPVLEAIDHTMNHEQKAALMAQVAKLPTMIEALTDIRNRILCPVGPAPTLDEIQQIASRALSGASDERS
jgi:hypothetical protein